MPGVLEGIAGLGFTPGVEAEATCEVCGWTPDGEAATDWIAFGVAVADGETGYVAVGPTPAKASGDGSRFRPNVLQLGAFQVGIEDLQPPPVMVAEPTTTKAKQRVNRALLALCFHLRIRAFLAAILRLVNPSRMDLPLFAYLISPDRHCQRYCLQLSRV